MGAVAVFVPEGYIWFEVENEKGVYNFMLYCVVGIFLLKMAHYFFAVVYKCINYILWNSVHCAIWINVE